MAKQFEMLPVEAERTRLIQALSNLIAKAGYERFACGVILEPVAEHFPDRVPSTRYGLRLLLHRLLTYVGLNLRVVLDVYDSENRYKLEGEEDDGLHAQQGAAAWFAGIINDEAHFGVDVQQLLDAPNLLGTLSHEVAHAFREHHGLVVRDRDVEERLTDLTTVYLGFGILTTNASYVYRATSRFEGGWVHSEVSEKQGGYLAPNEMAFLLAVQCTLRGLLDDELAELERKAIDAALETTQREMFRAALRVLRSDADRLCIDLGVPELETWPAPAQLPEVPSLERSGEEAEDEELLQHGVQRERNQGAVVFRVRSPRSISFAFFAALFGVLVFVFLLKETPHGGWFIAVSALFGFVAGRAMPTYSCSDPDCGAELTASLGVCPRCAGHIRGTIAARHDRLAAEEAITPERAPLLSSEEANASNKDVV